MDLKRLSASIGRTWDDSIVERLIAYVRIPNQSPLFDPQWEQHGYMEQAITLMADWCRAQPIPGARVEVRRLPGRTPLLLVDIPGELPGSVLLYGHLDKQPEFTGWLEGLGPWQPVLRDGKLYGRGAADDGYAVFSSLTAIAALKEQQVRLPRCVVLIEACEESGSVDLPAHLEALGSAIGDPSLVVCLDAECGNYEQVWCTTSLRGNLVGTLRVRVLTEGVHSGMATGIAPTPFRILEQLLARLENPVTGDLLLDELHVTLPADRRAQAVMAARVLGDEVAGRLPWIKGAHALSNDPAELIINNTWRATLAVTGAEGLPPLQSAGNVLLPEVACKLSLRLPPTCDAQRATHAVREALEREPPYGAQVSFDGRPGYRRLECARLRALARGGDHARLARRLPPRRGAYRLRRHHSVHGDAGRALPEDPVLHHRGARSACQRTRSERVPAPGVRQAPDGVRVARARRARADARALVSAYRP